MKLDARLTFATLRHDQDSEAHLILSLTAPPLAGQEKRQRICIVPVIDCSPSMLDDSKFEYAKRSVEKLIDHLAPGDYCGLITFHSTAQVVQKPIPLGPGVKEDLKRKVTSLVTSGGTNIASALLLGLEVANKMDLPGEVLTRVILFTDGEANTGPAIKTPDILKLVEPNLGLASVSAFGYGRGANAQLLSEMAKLGKANYAFVQNPDDALTAFGKELGGLLSTHATDIHLNVSPLAGHEIVSVISDVDAEEEKIGGDVAIKIPDILAEETRHIVLSVKIKEQPGMGPRAVNVFEVKGGFDVLDGTGKKQRDGVEAKAKVQFVKKGEEQTKPDADLDKIVGLAELVRAQLEAEEMVKKHDFAGAQVKMKGMATNARKRGQTQVAHLADNIGSRLGSADAYHGGSQYLASVSRGVTRGMGVASYDSAAAADLGVVGVCMSNSSQTGTSNAFAGGGVHHSIVTGGGVPVAGSVIPSNWVAGGAAAPAPIGGAIWVGPPSPDMIAAAAGQPAPLPPTNEEKKEPVKASSGRTSKIGKKKSQARW